MTNVVWVAWEWSERRWHWSYSGWGSAWVASVNKTLRAAEPLTCELHAAACVLCAPIGDDSDFFITSLAGSKLSAQVGCFPQLQQCSEQRQSAAAGCSGSWGLGSVAEREKRQGGNLLSVDVLLGFCSPWRTAECLCKCCPLSLYSDPKISMSSLLVSPPPVRSAFFIGTGQLG